MLPPAQEGYPDSGVCREFDYHTGLGTYCCLFVDDILCYSRTLENHVRHLRQVCVCVCGFITGNCLTPRVRVQVPGEAVHNQRKYVRSLESSKT